MVWLTVLCSMEKNKAELQISKIEVMREDLSRKVIWVQAWTRRVRSPCRCLGAGLSGGGNSKFKDENSWHIYWQGGQWGWSWVSEGRKRRWGQRNQRAWQGIWEPLGVRAKVEGREGFTQRINMICLLFSTLCLLLKQMEEEARAGQGASKWIVVIIQARDDYWLGPRVRAGESVSSV